MSGGIATFTIIIIITIMFLLRLPFGGYTLDIPHCQIHLAPSEVRNHHRCQGAQISKHLTSGVTSFDTPR
jgi:hypothetical protein